jgi:hypothetical protein
MFERVTRMMTSELAALRASTGRPLKQNPRLSFTQPRSINDGYFPLRRPESLSTLPLPTRDSVASSSDDDGGVRKSGGRAGSFHRFDGHADAFLEEDEEEEEEEDHELATTATNAAARPHAVNSTKSPGDAGLWPPTVTSVGYRGTRGDVQTNSPSLQPPAVTYGGTRGRVGTPSPSPSPSPQQRKEDNGRVGGVGSGARPAPLLPARDATSPSTSSQVKYGKLLAAATARDRPDLADPKLLHQLSFLTKGPGNDVALEVLLEGLGEGWLTVADLLHATSPLPSAAPAASAVAAESKSDWRAVGAIEQRKHAERHRRSDSGSGSEDEGDDALPRRQRRSHRHRKAVGPEIHVHIGGGAVGAAQMVGHHYRPPPPPPQHYQQRYPVQRAHVDLQPHTTVLEDSVRTEEYVVNADGTETNVGVSPPPPPSSSSWTRGGGNVGGGGGGATSAAWRPGSQSAPYTHHLDGTVVDEQVFTQE